VQFVFVVQLTVERLPEVMCLDHPIHSLLRPNHNYKLTPLRYVMNIALDKENDVLLLLLLLLLLLMMMMMMNSIFLYTAYLLKPTE